MSPRYFRVHKEKVEAAGFVPTELDATEDNAIKVVGNEFNGSKINSFSKEGNPTQDEGQEIKVPWSPIASGLSKDSMRSVKRETRKAEQRINASGPLKDLLG